MRVLIPAFIAAAALSAAPVVAQEPTAGDAKQAVAVKYFEALIAGDVETADALAGVPYSFDRKEIFKTKEEVAAGHRKILESKGKREIPKYTVAKALKAPPLDPIVFPKYDAYEIKIDTESIYFYVTGDTLTWVIGLSD